LNIKVYQIKKPIHTLFDLKVHYRKFLLETNTSTKKIVEFMETNTSTLEDSQ